MICLSALEHAAYNLKKGKFEIHDLCYTFAYEEKAFLQLQNSKGKVIQDREDIRYKKVWEQRIKEAILPFLYLSLHETILSYLKEDLSLLPLRIFFGEELFFSWLNDVYLKHFQKIRKKKDSNWKIQNVYIHECIMDDHEDRDYKFSEKTIHLAPKLFSINKEIWTIETFELNFEQQFKWFSKRVPLTLKLRYDSHSKNSSMTF